MSKTGIIWLMMYVGGLGASFVKGPIIALLAYCFTYYTQLSWGHGAGHHRWSLYAAAALFLTYLYNKKTNSNDNFLKNTQMKWLLFIVINMLIVSFFAVDPVENKAAIIDFIKVVILYYVIINVVQTRLHYKMFIWMQIFGNYLLGWQAFTHGKLTAGRLENINLPGVGDSNLLSLHLLLILPFLGLMILQGNKWEKAGAGVTAAFVINSIIMCNSRGAFLSMALMCIVAIVLAKQGMRLKIFIGLIIGGVLFVQIVDEKFWNRMQTVKTYEEDGSAMGRLESWARAIDMIGDYPFGKGGGGWEALSPIYIPEIVEGYGGQKRAVHNTYLMMATDWGVQGLLCLLFFLVGTLRTLLQIMKNSLSDEDDFFYIQGMATGIAIIGYLFGAIFLNRIYAEGLYWYCAIVQVLNNVRHYEMVQQKTGGKI